MVFGEPCVTIVVPVCDRVPAGRSAFPGHAVTWSFQVEWLSAACGIHGFCKSPKQVCMHIVAWPLSSFRDGPFCLNIFMILVDFNMLINWQSNVGCVSTLWPFFPLECDYLMHKTHFILLWGGWKMHFSCPFHDYQLKLCALTAPH